jgi:hypothetical protein
MSLVYIRLRDHSIKPFNYFCMIPKELRHKTYRAGNFPVQKPA